MVQRFFGKPKISCLPLFKKVGMLYGKSNGTFLCQEFHYELIFTWPEKTRSSLPMWWLLTQHGKRWLQVSLINQQMQLWNLTPLLRSTSIKVFMKGITLFWWSWRCMGHLGMIWIISSRSVLVFSTIDNQKVIYLWFFAFDFSSSVLILFFNVL